VKQPLTLALCLALSACATTQAPYQAPMPSVEGPSLAEVSRHATTIDLGAPLPPDALATIAVLANPDLKALRAQKGVADAQIFAVGLLPDPSFSIGADAPLNGSGLVTALSGSIGLDLASLATRPARLRAAHVSAGAVQQEIAWAEWLTSEQARLLAERLSWLSAIQDKTGRMRQLAEDDLARVLAAAARGDVSAIEVDARRLVSADASDRDRTAESQLAAARLELNRLLGIDPAETVVVAAVSGKSPETPDLHALFQLAVEGRADLVALRQGLSAASSGVAGAHAAQFPLPSVSVNAGRDTGDIRTLGPSVSLNLPVWNRGRGDVAVSKADLARLEAEYAARLEAVRADIAASATSLAIARSQLADVTRDLADLNDQAGATDRAAERGDVAVTIAAATRMAALDKDILADSLSLAAAEAAIALEIAVGARLELPQ